MHISNKLEITKCVRDVETVLLFLVLGTEEMAQWLTALIIFAEDLGSILSTHMVVHNHP